MKKYVSILLAVCIFSVLLTVPCTRAQAAENPFADLTEFTFVTDGQHNLTDGKFKTLFEGGAKKAIPVLIEEGMVRVNGQTIGTGEVTINGGQALWQNENGTWAWKTHILNHGEKIKDYAKAAYEFTIGISRLRGPSFTIAIEDGKAAAIDFLVQDACLAQTVTRGEEYTEITTCGPSDGSMGRTDPGTVRFPNQLVESDREGNMPDDNCFVLYWEDQDGWHLKRADSRRAVIPAGYEDYVDTRINLEYAQPWNRPSQAIDVIGRLDGETAEMEQWFMGEKYTCGFSRVNPGEDLRQAAVYAEAFLETVIPSADGQDVDEGVMWVTPEEYALFAQLVEQALKAAESTSALPGEQEKLLYALALSYGGTGRNHKGHGNVYEDGIGIRTRAQRNANPQAEE